MPAGEHLPHIDEHSTEIGASAGATWEALLQVMDRSFDSPATARGSRLLGCADTSASGPRPLARGSAFPGFHIEVADRPTELTGGDPLSLGQGDVCGIALSPSDLERADTLRGDGLGALGG
jgi:hypothetical protein